MRIIAGKRRGMTLSAVGKGDAAAHLRPTTDRVRESLFNLLLGGRYGDPVTDARVLDLFAGTGALGLEAWSRGAAHVSFVESGRPALALIAANIAKAKAEGETSVMPRNATRLGVNAGAPFVLIFLDPPYGKGLGAQALASARAGGWIAPGALVAWEDSTPQSAPEGFELLDTRRYGGTHLTLLEAVTVPPDATG